MTKAGAPIVKSMAYTEKLALRRGAKNMPSPDCGESHRRERLIMRAAFDESFYWRPRPGSKLPPRCRFRFAFRGSCHVLEDRR